MSRSINLGMEASKKADPDKELEMEPVTSSHKLWRMGETNPWLLTRDQVVIEATQTAAKVTEQLIDLSSTHQLDRPPADALPNQGEMKIFDLDAGILKWKNMSPVRATLETHRGQADPRSSCLSHH